MVWFFVDGDDLMAVKLIKHTFESVSDFNPRQTFLCGQCFRWDREDDGSFTGVIEGSFANISFVHTDPKSSLGELRIVSNYLADNPERSIVFWRNYLDMDRDYGAIKKILATEDKVMAKAIQASGGIRILNQNKWETLISFIISQNNNIPRIKKCIEKLCNMHGKRIGTVRNRTLYSFPSVDRLSTLREEDLADCRLGYRARYIVEAARQVAYDGGAMLETGEDMDTGQLDRYLQSLSGVGPKVSNCIMLFSMKKLQVFPIDVWVKRVMNRFYGMGEENVSAMKDYAERNFGNYGGLAQQYLFHYIRDMAKANPVLYKRLDFDTPFEKDESLVAFR
jgi:N-glycosylase/DNA lyase